MSYEAFKRWMYRGDHPHLLARILNRFWGVVHTTGIAPDDWVTLEVIGRKSGRVVSLPVVMAVVDNQRYLVSMLGDNAQWVLNVRAAQGEAAIVKGGREAVQLVEIPAEQRAPIIKEYLKRAPGARPHIPVDKDAPLEEFQKIAVNFPVFRVRSQRL